MKKALKINLSGRIFHIDEDAYEKLKNYLDTISSHFSNIEESKEIINDIETRIAELLGEMLKDDSQVITISQVDEIIEIMGKPEEIIDDDSTDSKGKEYQTRSRQGRRLYRDPDNSVLGGVAAGMSAYFGIDLLLIRILFVIFALVSAGFPVILLYLVLWIAIPKAETAAEKLEMRGEKVNLSNLERKVREEYEDVKDNIKKARSSKAGKRAEDAFSELFRILGVILVAFVKIIIAIVAIGFVIAGVSLIASMVGVAFFGVSAGSWGMFHIWDHDISPYVIPFVNPVNITVIGIAGIMVVLIPVLAILYGLFKALFKFKAKDKTLGAGAFFLWFLSLITVITMAFSEIKNFKEEDHVKSSYEFDKSIGDTLYISTNKYGEDILDDSEHFNFNDYNYFVNANEDVYGEMNLYFRKADSDVFELVVEKGSRGKSYSEVGESIENLEFNYKIEGNQLSLDPCFLSEYNNKWRFQTIDITIYVPENKAIQFNKNSVKHIEYIRTDYHGYKGNLSGKTLIMKGNQFVE